MQCNSCKNECKISSNGMCCICQIDEIKQGNHRFCEICIPRFAKRESYLQLHLSSVPRPTGIVNEEVFKPHDSDFCPYDCGSTVAYQGGPCPLCNAEDYAEYQKTRKKIILD